MAILGYVRIRPSVIALYVQNHWYGRHGLLWSLLVNLIALRGVIMLAQHNLEALDGRDYSNQPLAILGLAAVFHVLAFVWQIVGVLRAAERHVRDRGGIAPA